MRRGISGVAGRATGPAVEFTLSRKSRIRSPACSKVYGTEQLALFRWLVVRHRRWFGLREHRRMLIGMLSRIAREEAGEA